MPADEVGEKWLVRIQALDREHLAVHRLLETVQKRCHGSPEENVETFLDALSPVIEAHEAAGTSG